MPRYQITDSATGRTLVIEGDSPPTEQEAAELFGSMGEAASADSPAIIAERMRGEGASEKSVRNYLEQAEADRAGIPRRKQPLRGGPNDMGFAGMPHEDQRQMLATGVRYGAPLAAGLMTGGASLIPAALAIGGAGATAELAAQGIEGEGLRAGDVAKAGIVNAVPMGSVIKPLTQATGAAAAMGRMAETGAKFAAGEAVGETTRRSIEAGELTGYDSPGEAVRSLALAGGLGSGLHGVAELAGKLAAKGAERAANLRTLAAGGVEKPSLDLIWPSQAANVERAIAAGDKTLAAAKLDAMQPLMDQYAAIVQNAPRHEAVFAQLRPQIGKLDAARAGVAEAEVVAAKAAEAAAAAEASAAISPAQRAAATQAATVAQLNAINTRAAHLHAQQQVLGPLLDHDTVAQGFTALTEQLFATRKEVGARMFTAAGLPEGAPLFDKAALAAAAKAGLGGRWAGTEVEKRILGAIEQAGGEEAAGLTLAQFRELRQSFADRFADLDPRQLGAAEAASRAAYGAVTAETQRIIGATPGANLQAYNAAVGYWRETAEAAASRYVRPLLAAEPGESTFASLASDLASGKKAEVRAFNEFVEAITREAPEIANVARAQLTGAIRNSFLQQSRGPAGGVDSAALARNLLKAHGAGTLDIATLGFGSASEVRQWSQILRKWELNTLPEADFAELFSTPAVQQALAEGRPMADAMAPAAARIAFGEAVRRQTLASLVKDKAAARQAAATAERAATAARLSLEERRAIAAAAEADPVAQAFADGQTWGIPARPGAPTEGNSTGMTNTMLRLGEGEGLRLHRALTRANPVLAEQVERRVLADVLRPFFRPSIHPGRVWALDKAEVQRFFHPAPGSTEVGHAATIKALVGADRWAGMEKIAQVVGMAADLQKSGGVVTSDGAKTIFVNAGLGRQLGGVGAVSLAKGTLLGFSNLANRGRVHLLGALAKPGPVQDAFFQASGDLDRMLTLLPFNAQLQLMRDRAIQAEIRAARAEKNPPPPAPGPN